VLGPTAQRLTGPWLVRHDAERPEIEQDAEHMTSGGWQLQQRSATRDSAIVFSIATGALRSSLYHGFATAQARARFAAKTWQALAFE
jgi:hypothetical protein